MSGRMSEVESVKAAKKIHRCDWCWGFVRTGDSYQRYRCYSYGEASTVRLHPECYEAMIDAADEEGGWIEWTPGRERPSVAVE